MPSLRPDQLHLYSVQRKRWQRSYKLANMLKIACYRRFLSSHGLSIPLEFLIYRLKKEGEETFRVWKNFSRQKIIVFWKELAYKKHYTCFKSAKLLIQLCWSLSEKHSFISCLSPSFLFSPFQLSPPCHVFFYKLDSFLFNSFSPLPNSL